MNLQNFQMMKTEFQDVAMDQRKREAKERGWSLNRTVLICTILKVTQQLSKFGITAYYNDQMDDETIREAMKLIGKSLIEASEENITEVF
jgi:hypothetical protein